MKSVWSLVFKFFLSLTVFAFSLLLSGESLIRPCAASLYEEGLLSLKNEKYEEAADLFLEEAKNSLDSKSIHELIQLILTNRIKKDTRDALEKPLAELACKASGLPKPQGAEKEQFPKLKVLEKPLPLALSNLGLILENGIGTPSSLDEAIELFKTASKAKDPLALQKLENLGTAYLYGTTVKQDLDKAIDLLSFPANTQPSAQALIGIALFEKAKLEENSIFKHPLMIEATRHLEKSLEMKEDQDAKVYQTLAMIYASKDTIEDTRRSIKYHEIAAEKGDIGSIKALANHFRSQKNIEKAKEYFRKGDELGDPESQVSLGILLGEESPESEILFLKAAMKKPPYPAALYKAGMIFYRKSHQNSSAASKLLDKAYEYFEKAAELKYAHAFSMLGVILEDSNYQKADPHKALSYFQKALDAGNKEAREDVERLEKTLGPCRQDTTFERMNDAIWQISAKAYFKDINDKKAHLKGKIDLSALDRSLCEEHNAIKEAFQAIELQGEKLEKTNPTADYAELSRSYQESKDFSNERKFKEFETLILTKSGWGKQLKRHVKEIDQLLSKIEEADLNKDRSLSDNLKEKKGGAQFLEVWQPRFQDLNTLKKNLLGRKHTLTIQKNLFETYQNIAKIIKRELAEKIQTEVRPQETAGLLLENPPEQKLDQEIAPEWALLPSEEVPDKEVPSKKKKKNKKPVQPQTQNINQNRNPVEEEKEDPSQKKVSVNITSKDDVKTMLNKITSNDGQTPLVKNAVLDLREHFEKNGHQVPDELTDARFKNRGPLTWPAHHVHVINSDHVLLYYYYVLDGVSYIKFVDVEKHPTDEYKQWNELAAKVGADLRRRYPRAHFPKK